MATNIIDAVDALEAGKTLTIAKDAAGNKVAHKVTLTTTAVTAEKQELEYTKTSAGKIEVDINEMCFVKQLIENTAAGQITCNYGIGNYIINDSNLRNQLTSISEFAFGANNEIGMYSTYGGPEDLMLPNCKKISDGAFNCVGYQQYTNPLKSIDLPVCTEIGNDAFYYCLGLTSINIPQVTSIGTYAFCGIPLTGEYTFPSVISISNGAFSSCTFSRISLPAATSIGNGVFAFCSDDLVIDLSENENFSVANEAQYRSDWDVPEGATIIFHDSAA